MAAAGVLAVYAWKCLKFALHGIAESRKEGTKVVSHR